MADTPPRDVINKIRKLSQLPQEARECMFAVSVTRLTSLKSLCQQPEVANRFVTHLARKVLQRVKKGKSHTKRSGDATDRAHRKMMAEALAEMEGWLGEQSEERRRALCGLLTRMRAEQNEYRTIPYAAVRQIHDWDLLLIEDAVGCLLAPASEAGRCAYQMARDYAERYDSSHGTGLIPESAPLLQDILEFFYKEFDLDARSLAAPAPQKKTKEKKQPAAGAGKSTKPKKKAKFTPQQGQFLAFIHQYHKLHRQAPAEHEMVSYFGLTPPSVHSMIVRLEQRGLITRKPGVPRSVQVAIPEAEIPPLQGVNGLPWSS